ncbi:helix-turn-helix transcriptional regulator [Pseudoxanthomonas kalamensis]|uniref:helix-turn-helix transcriptional regulator n=1 Tax=Pseudoxanthomonas kalamensis TaxID=289483 RepID=UPI001391A384|nr:helix-turn-helix transcriptional regulator [Pseudoxanthomonas kalamensis]
MTPQERIRLARRTAGMSQQQLAREIGVQRSAVSHWESAQGGNPSLSHLREVAVVTHTQFEWLATGRGSMSLPRETALDSVAAAQALLVEDPLEFRLVSAFRDAPLQARMALLEVMETLARQRLGRSKRTAATGGG